MVQEVMAPRMLGLAIRVLLFVCPSNEKSRIVIIRRESVPY